MKIKTLFALLLVLAIALPGCAIRKDLTAKAEKTEQDFQERLNFKGGLKAFGEVNAPYIDAFATNLSNGHGYLKGKKITVRDTGAYLADIGDKISAATGCVVRYSPDLAKRRDVANTTMNIKYSGDLKAFLDKVAAYYNISWEYNRETNTILFFYMKTKTYSVPVHLADLTVETTVSNESDSSNDSAGSAQGGSAGESTQDVETKGETKAWDDLLKNVQAMITRDGSVVVSKGAGTITVTESPVILARIDEFMQNISNKMSRQVSLNIKIYTFNTNDEFNFGADIKGAFNDGYTSLAFGGVPVDIQGTGFLATVLKNTDTFHKNWNGSEGFINLLKTKGRVHLETTASGITQNNQPMPVQALRRTTYLASSSTTLNGDNSETQLTPGQVVSGTSVLVTPHIQADDVVNIDYNMSYSVLESIGEISAGGTMIQTPQVASRTIMQRFQAYMNSTIIIAGYASNQMGEDTDGHILGFGWNTSDAKEYMIIIIDIKDATLPAYKTDMAQ